MVASFSDLTYVNSGEILLWPKGFTLLGYQRVFKDDRILTGYMNTIFYTAAGTGIGVCSTMLAAYSLSRKDLPGRKNHYAPVHFYHVFFRRYDSVYLVVKGLKLVNSRVLMVLFGCIFVYNIIIARSFLESSIPDELHDAASIDGCGNGRFFLQIVLPLSKAVIAVIALYLAVRYWNSYFNVMIFLTDSKKYPLQLFLRQILLTVSQSASVDTSLDPEALMQMGKMGQVIKYGVIVVSTAPIICVYPFIQKYFVKGVMIGSVKLTKGNQMISMTFAAAMVLGLASTGLTAKAEEEKTTFTIAVYKNALSKCDDFNEMKIFQMAEEATGVHIEWMPVEAGSGDKINAMLTADLPDAFLGLLNESKIAMNMDLFADLSGLLEEHAPHVFFDYNSMENNGIQWNSVYQ